MATELWIKVTSAERLHVEVNGAVFSVEGEALTTWTKLEWLLWAQHVLEYPDRDGGYRHRAFWARE